MALDDEAIPAFAPTPRSVAEAMERRQPKQPLRLRRPGKASAGKQLVDIAPVHRSFGVGGDCSAEFILSEVEGRAMAEKSVFGRFAKERRNGFAMIEAIVSIAVIAAFFLAFAGLALRTRQISRAITPRLKAIFALGEGVEITRDIEKRNWAVLSDVSCADPAVCHPDIISGEWVLIPGAEMMTPDGITRSVSTTDVWRDTLSFPNVIVETGGVVDPDTRRVTISVAWTENGRPRDAKEIIYVYR